MAAKTPLRILCLDGGGVRGLSSLHILKELMSQIRRNDESRSRQKSRSPLRPCDYFDLICGTGTGGILAIMLGRLQYVSRYQMMGNVPDE
jgi:patatin-like phospholipase/acyl hydrolase